MKEEEIFLKNNIENNSTIIVSCSGGPDSMALLSVINNIKDEKKLKIICAHVNHKVREESDEEAQMVEKYAKGNDDIFELFEIKEYHDKANFHEDARKIRYKFLSELKTKYNAKYLLTAHHGDDLTETVLMRITRGSNLKGYIGFKEISKWEDINLLRPLIHKTKKELEEYDKKNNVPYRIDNTNYSNEYTRNRYRNNIIPLLKEEEKNIHLKYLKFSKELEKYKEYVDNEANKHLEMIVDENNNIIISKFNELPNLIKETIIGNIITKYQLDNYLPITDELFSSMLSTLNSKKTNILIDLPNNYVFGKEYDRLIFTKKEDSVDSLDYIMDKDYIGKDFDICFVKEYDKSNYSIALNSEELNLPVRLRFRKDGDQIEILNLNGKKKIKDIFINEKVPVNKRNKYPLLVDNNDNVIWIPGLKKSKFAKEKDEKYDIILRCEEK